MTDEVSFYKYAALVKNLRGVIYWKQGHEDKLRWLLSRFRYRNLGVPPSLAENLAMKRKVLVKLAYPSPQVKEAVSVFARALSPEAAEALCLASAYVSPLMLVGVEHSEFGPAVVDYVATDRELTDKEWKLHMRIADYTVLDFYAWSLDSAARALFENKLDNELKEREKRIKEDKRRYWRIASEKGRPLLIYLDPLRAASEYGLIDALRQVGRDCTAVLGIVAALVIS